MFRVFGKPPSSDYLELAQKEGTFVPPAELGRAKLFLTDGRKLRVVWEDGVTSEFATVALSYLSSFRNRIINGDFSVWQRAASKTGVSTTGYYTADRWVQALNTGALDITKSSMNGRNSLKVTVNTPPDLTAAGSFLIPVQYRFEGQHLYDINAKANDITISFLFRSNVTGTFCVSVRNFTDTSVQVESYVHEFSYSTAGSVVKVSFTVPFSRTFNPPLRNDANLGIVLDFFAVAGATYQTSSVDSWLAGSFVSTPSATNWASTAGNFVEIAEVQLEEGDTATDFEFVPFEVQLWRCMRYYFRTDRGYSDPNNLGHFYVIKSGAYFRRILVPFPVEMRAVPTISFISTASAEAGASNRPFVYWRGRLFVYLGNDQTGDYWVGVPHFQADAEL